MRKYVYSFLALVFIVSGLSYEYLKQSVQDKSSLSTTLKPNEKIKIIKDNRKVKIIKRNPNGSQTETDISGNRHTTVTQDNNGNISIVSPNHGFIFEPGVVLGGDSQVKVGLDTQLYYWNNWGFNIGLMSDNAPHIRFYVAGSYNIYSNTSLFAGLNQRKEITFGIRVQL